MKTLIDIIHELQENKILMPPYDIEYRVTLPSELVHELGEWDTLYGYCHWDGEKLTSLDGDNYYLDDEFIYYEVFDVPYHMAEYHGEKALSVTMSADWSSEEPELSEKESDDENSDENLLIDNSFDEDYNYIEKKKRTRADRRRNDYRKALRKKQRLHDVRNTSYYDNLHQFSKNAIPRSSWNNQNKTNLKNYKGGRVSERYKLDHDKKPYLTKSKGHEGLTSHRMGANYTANDIRKYEQMQQQLREYENGAMPSGSQVQLDINCYMELVKAIFDAIDAEYRRLFWNKNQKEAESPFLNTGASYRNLIFSVSAYNWNDGELDDDSDINFCYRDDFCASWYKHSNRGLRFWRKDSSPITAEYLNEMLKDCLTALKRDFTHKSN